MRFPRQLTTLVVLACAFMGASSSAAAQAPSTADVTGKWLLTVETSAGTGTPTLTLTQKGDSIGGHYSSQALGEADVKGSVSGKKITITLNVEMQGTPLVVTYAGTIESATAMKGTVDIGGQATGTFIARRQ
ncbi:hypothetical protein BH11GEM1_BH11GEM1_31490 [soil metagenome]